MGDDPDSGHPTPRDNHETSTPLSSEKRVPFRQYIAETFDQSALDRSILSPAQPSPRSKSKASHVHADEDIREVIRAERAEIAKKKLERTLEEEHRHVHDLKFDLNGQNVALEEARERILQKENEILQKAEEIGRLKQKITELEGQFAEERLKFQEHTADLQKEQRELFEQCERIRRDLEAAKEDSTRLSKEKSELENRLLKMEEEHRLKINELTTVKTDDETRAVGRAQALETELTTKQTELKKTAEELAATKAALEEAEAHGTLEKQRLEKMHEKQAQELSELKKELQDRPAREEFERLRGQNRDLDSRLEDKHRELEELEMEHSDLKRKLEKAKKFEPKMAEKTTLIDEQLTLIKNLQELEADSEKKIQELELKLLSQQQDSSRKDVHFEQEKTALLQRLADSEQLQKSTKMSLESAETRLRAHNDEKSKIQAKVDRLTLDLAREKSKIADLEAMSGNLAEKELQASRDVDTIKKELCVKQKEYAKMTEELTSTLMKLTLARDRIASLEAAAAQNAFDVKKHEELERLNAQMTSEVDFLRGETKTRPSRAEFQRYQKEMEQLQMQLTQKHNDHAELKKEYDAQKATAATSKDLQTDLERKMEIIREQEAEITRMKSSCRSITEELAEKIETTEKIVEEFERYKLARQAEIDELVVKLETANKSCRAMHQRLQQQEVASALGGASSTVWELLPESLRKDLPTNLAEALQSLRIGRADVLSRTDSQNSDHVDSCSKVADALESFYRKNGRSSLASYNILQLTSKLIRASINDSTIADFSQSIAQFVEKREQKLEEQIAELRQKVDEERRAKFDYHSKSHSLELELDDERRGNERLQLNITSLKAELGDARNNADIRQGQLTRLQEEVAKLKQIEAQYKESMTAFRQTAVMITERDRDLDQLHEEEMRLHHRLRFAESEAERLKREQEELRTDQHSLRLENLNFGRRLVEADQKLTRLADVEKKLTAKLEHEVKVKRFNQETMRRCIEYMDQYKQAVEHLKSRNLQRQQVLDNIQKDLLNVSSKKNLGAVAESNLRHLNEHIPGWKRLDEEQEQTIREIGRNYNHMIRERSTAELRTAFHDVQDSKSQQQNKENRPTTRHM